MTFKPYCNEFPQVVHRVFVKLDTPEEASAGGILIPEKAKDKPRSGTVTDSSTPNLRPGDRVLFDSYGGRDFDIDHVKFKAFDEAEIVGISRKEEGNG